MSDPGLDRNSSWNSSRAGQMSNNNRRRRGGGGNRQYCQQQQQQQEQRQPARFYEYDLVGDDFFMNMSYSELNASLDRSKFNIKKKRLWAIGITHFSCPI